MSSGLARAQDRPLSYSAIERTFFREFIYKKALETAIDEGMERGENPRVLEREQMVKLMTLLAEILFVGKWDPETGAGNWSTGCRRGTPYPKSTCGHGASREEILATVMGWVRLIVIENYNAYTGRMIDKEKLLHSALPEDLWKRIRNFLTKLVGCLAGLTRSEYHRVWGQAEPRLLEEGLLTLTPTGVRVLAQPLNLQTMIQD